MDGKKHAFTDETNSADISYYFNGGLYVKLLKTVENTKKHLWGHILAPHRCRSEKSQLPIYLGRNPECQKTDKPLHL